MFKTQQADFWLFLYLIVKWHYVFFTLLVKCFLFYFEQCPKYCQSWHYTKIDKYCVGPESVLSPFQKHENEEDGASGNKDGNEREKKETDVALSFVFGQNIKDRAKVRCVILI